MYQVSDSGSFLAGSQKRLLNSEESGREWGEVMRPSLLTSDTVGQCSAVDEKERNQWQKQSVSS